MRGKMINASRIMAIIALIAMLVVPASLPASAGSCNPCNPPQLNLSHIECVNGQVERHYVLLNVPDGVTPADHLTDNYGNIPRGANTGNVWHYTAYSPSGVYNVTWAQVVVNGVTVNLHNPGAYAGTYNCAPTATPTPTSTSTANIGASATPTSTPTATPRESKLEAWYCANPLKPDGSYDIKVSINWNGPRAPLSITISTPGSCHISGTWPTNIGPGVTTVDLNIMCGEGASLTITVGTETTRLGIRPWCEDPAKCHPHRCPTIETPTPTPSPTSTEEPVPPCCYKGWIVYQKQVGTAWQLFRWRPGESAQQITSTGSNWNPSLSFDGQWVVFVSDRHGNPDVFKVKIDGTEETRLTSDQSGEDRPVFWCNKIIYDREGKLWEMGLDGSGQRILLDDPAAQELHPAA